MADQDSEPRSAAIGGTIALGAVALALAAWAAFASDEWFELHFTHTYCLVDEAIATKLHVSRAAAAILAVVLVVVVRPRLARRMRGVTIGTVAGHVLRIGLAIVLAFVATELVLRFFRARHAKAAPPPAAPLFTHDPLEDVDVTAGPRKFHIALNKDKVRRRSIHDDPDPEAPSLVFIGESVAFGYGLDYDESIPALVEARTGVQAISLGVNGFASDEALEWLKSSMTKIKHPIAVVSFVVTNGIGRVIAPLRYHLVVRPGGGLELAKPEEPSVLESSPLWTALHAAIPYHDERAVALTNEIVRGTATYARSVGATPLFVLTETPARCVRPSPPAVAKIAAGEEKSTIRILYPESMQNPADVHPNPLGAVHFADEIVRALRDANVVH